MFGTLRTERDWARSTGTMEVYGALLVTVGSVIFNVTHVARVRHTAAGDFAPGDGRDGVMWSGLTCSSITLSDVGRIGQHDEVVGYTDGQMSLHLGLFDGGQAGGMERGRRADCMHHGATARTAVDYSVCLPAERPMS